ELAIHIGMLLQHLFHPIEILRPSHVKRNEGRLRMPRKNTITRLEQRLQARILRAIKAPVRMLDQLLIPFILSIDWMEKSFRISRMNGNRNAQPPALIPNWVKLRIVDGQQLAGILVNSQAKIFQNLQPARGATPPVIDLLDHLLREIRIVNPAPINLSEHYETPRMWLHHFVDYALQLVSPRPGKDNDCPDIQVIHALEQLCRGNTVLDAHGIVHVLVHVNHWKAGALHFMCGDVKHGLRMKIAQEQSLVCLRTFRRLVTDLLCNEVCRDRQSEPHCDKKIYSSRFFAHGLPRLERKLQSKLNQTWIARRLSKPESTVRIGIAIGATAICEPNILAVLGGDIFLDVVGIAKQRIEVVPGIKEFRPEFQSHLLSYTECFEDRNVPVLEARSANDIPAGISRAAGDRVGRER